MDESGILGIMKGGRRILGEQKKDRRRLSGGSTMEVDTRRDKVNANHRSNEWGKSLQVRRSIGEHWLHSMMEITEHWVYFSCNVLEWEAYDPYRERWINLPRMPHNECFMFSDKAR